MTDTVRVAELLREIASLTEAAKPTCLESLIHDRAQAALRAIGEGEKAEEWLAYQYAAGKWAVAVKGRRVLATDMDAATAKRLAALPRLERAAREVVVCWFGSDEQPPRREMTGPISLLNAALKEPQP